MPTVAAAEARTGDAPASSSPGATGAPGSDAEPLRGLRLPGLEVFVARCRASRPLRLWPLPTVSLHGALERALRRQVCVARDRPRCAGCPAFEDCPFAALMRPAPLERPRAGGAGHSPPKPYAIAPDEGLLPTRAAGWYLPAGREVAFRLTLLAEAAAHREALLEALGHALELLGPRSSADGRWQPALRLVDIQTAPQAEEVVAAPARPPGDAVELRFVTPFRIKAGGRLTGRLDAGTLLEALGRRAALLGAEGLPATPEERARLAAGLQLERLESRLVQVRRYSSRQGRQMSWPGVVGRWRLRGEALQPLWPLLRFGAHAQVGKATSFGFGRYELLDAGGASPPP